MSFHHKIADIMAIASIGIATAMVGGGAVTSASISGAGDILSGTYQRQYEDRFKEELTGQTTVTHLWRAVTLALFDTPSEGAVLGQGGWVYTAEEFRDPTTFINLKNQLKDTQSILAQFNIQLVPILVPDKARIVSDPLPYARSSAFQNRYDGAIRTVGNVGLPVIDLRDALASGGNGFLRTDTHWSPEGAQRVARKLAQHLTTAKISRTGFKTVQTGQDDLQADLAAFYDTGRFHTSKTPAPEQIASYETTGGGTDLFGAGAVDIALVGTSFSARSDLHFLGFLKSEIGADVVSYATQGQGPFGPMADFLTTLRAGDMVPPKIVIWEIPERYIPLER